MKKIINAPENYVDDMLKGIYTLIFYLHISQPV